MRRKKGGAHGQCDSVEQVAAGDVAVEPQGSILWVHGILRLASLTGVGEGCQPAFGKKQIPQRRTASQ
ncbi:MAG: hypothetical protein DMG70_23805 [Acidobacteria bacterium]|nr:MAG: hypothetical protein DMG70_23805 [Acidobacteriota bacterium]